MKPTKTIITTLLILLLIASLTAITTADKPSMIGQQKIKPIQVKEITDDTNELIYFYEGDHSFNVYLKEYKGKGNHQKIQAQDNYKSIVQKGNKRIAFGWEVNIEPNTKLVAEVTSNYPMTQEGYKLIETKYNMNFEKEIANGWIITFEKITPTHYNVHMHKPDYKGKTRILIDPVVGENVNTIYYEITVCGNWTCDSYNTCEITDTQICNSVTGLPSGCTNTTFEGSYNDYNQSCDYCTPDWYCDTYDTCNYNIGYKNCLSVTDRNTCYTTTSLASDNFTGSLSTYRSTCGQGISPPLTESATGMAIMIDNVRVPTGRFLLFMGIIGAIAGLVAGIIFAIKKVSTKHM